MRLLLIDGHYYAYRSFYAIRQLTNSRGEPTNAVYGFVKTLQKMIQDLSPERAAIIFDSGPPARLAAQPDYKANRPETPKELETQIPVIHRVARALGFPILSIHGEEADDLIAAYTRAALQKNYEVILATNDKDIMQLVTPRCLVYQTNKDVFQLLGPADIEEKWGVSPSQIRDVLVLTGDAVDNVPGVPGIGPKTAAALIRQFNTVENLLAHPEKITSEKTREAIRQHLPQIQSNFQMFQLRDQLPLPQPIEALEITPDIPSQICEFTNLEFKSLLKQVQPQPASPPPSSHPVQGELF